MNVIATSILAVFGVFIGLVLLFFAVYIGASVIDAVWWRTRYTMYQISERLGKRKSAK